MSRPEEELSSGWILGSMLDTGAGPPTPSPFLGRDFGRYVLQEEIGRGAFGGVFRAHDPNLGRDVAVKILFRSEELAMRRFLRETEALASLRHPGVVQIHDFGRQEGYPYLVMDYLPGQPLSELCRPDALLPPRRAAEVLRDVAEVVEHAHQNGVIHRDLKPNNVILDESGRPTVLDFGLAFLRRAGDRLSASGSPLGTPAYMAPEQLEGELPSRATDVYGLGATLYHLLTGQVPLEGAQTTALLAVATYTPPSPHKVRRAVPKELSAICMRCLDKDPVDRIPTPGELAAALDRFLALPERAARPRLAPIVAGAALLAAAALGAIWALSGGGDPEPATPSRPETVTPAAAPSEAARRAVTLAMALARQRTPPEEILAGLDEAIALARDDVSLHHLLLVKGLLARCFGFYSEAVRIAEPLMTAPGETGFAARYLYGSSLSGMGQQASDLGEEVFAELARDDPAGKHGLTAQAELLVDAGRGPEAVQPLERALEQDPGWTPALNALAFSRLQEGDYAAARQLAERAAEERPWDPSCHVTLASVLGYQNDFEGALREVNVALELWGPRAHALTYGFRSKIYYELGALADARRDSERALLGRPDHVGSLLWAGALELYDGRKAAAAEYWRKAHASDPEKLELELEGHYPPSFQEQVRRAIGK